MQFKIYEIIRSTSLTDAEIDLCQKVIDELRQRPYFDHAKIVQIVIALAEFALKFRSDSGIQAMFDYIQWAKEHDKEKGILGTVMHDLNSRNDSFMSPRTSGYLKIKLKEDADE